MRRVLILVEGQTEERFVKEVLAPHLWDFGVHIDRQRTHRPCAEAEHCRVKLVGLLDRNAGGCLLCHEFLLMRAEKRNRRSPRAPAVPGALYAAQPPSVKRAGRFCHSFSRAQAPEWRAAQELATIWP